MEVRNRRIMRHRGEERDRDGRRVRCEKERVDKKVAQSACGITGKKK